jgi:hypothetical protein
MRSLVDDALAHGVKTEIVVEVAHRTSILPLVLAGVEHAVMPSSWAPTAHKAGLRTLQIEPVSHLDVAILSRKDGLTPAARPPPCCAGSGRTLRQASFSGGRKSGRHKERSRTGGAFLCCAYAFSRMRSGLRSAVSSSRAR